MVITVTLNPAIDKTVYVHGFRQGELNRVEKTTLTPGGKGINASLFLKELGEPSIAVGFFGGGTGVSVTGKLAIKGIRTEQVLVKGETRTNLKIISGNELTDVNEPGPEVTKEDIEKLESIILKYAEPGNIFIFAGTVPPGADTGIYYRLINMVKEKGSIAILDSDGDAFREGMKAVPYAIKPNLNEFFEYKDERFGGTIPEDYRDYVIEYAADIIADGVKFVCVSLGTEGSYFTDGVNNMFLSVPSSENGVKNTVGDGDSMTAAIAYGISRNLDFETVCELAMKLASSAGKE